MVVFAGMVADLVVVVVVAFVVAVREDPVVAVAAAVKVNPGVFVHDEIAVVVVC